jgi:hypothetical protein
MKIRWAAIAIVVGLLQATPWARPLQSAVVETASVVDKSATGEAGPGSNNGPDTSLYAEGTRAIHEGRWSDAVSIFTQVANAKSEYADAALYWKAYAENKQGQSSRALDTCAQLRRDFPKSRWMDECGALEIEIRAATAKPVEPQAEQDEELKLLALNALMKQDEPRALAELRPILAGDSSEEIKERALFIVAQGQSKPARELLKQIAQANSNPALQAKAAQMLASLDQKPANSSLGFTPDNSEQSGVPVNMVVTLEAASNAPVPEITRQDVMVYQGRNRAKVTDWLPLHGDHAGIDLFVAIEDVPSSSRGTQVEDLANFIAAQPSITKVGVAYLQQGAPLIAQSLTADHDDAAKAVRVTPSHLSRPDSPYFSLEDLIKQWPRGAVRREIVIVSNGLDYEDHGFVAQDNPFVTSTIDLARREGIIIFAISTHGLGNYLSGLANGTGGRLYFQASGVAVSIAPYLKDVAERLDRQYLVTFLAKPDKKAGLQSVKIKTEVPHAKLVSADKVYVPAAP